MSSAPASEIRGDVPVVDVDAFDPARFDTRSPLILRGGAARARAKWTDEWLVEHLGDGMCQVSLDSRPAMPAYKRHVPVGGYMASLAVGSSAARPQGYLFHSQRDGDGAAYLLGDLDVPETILGLGAPTLYRLFMGPSGSGTLPHVHTFALNALARGRKHWAIYVGAGRAETRELLGEADERYGSGSQAADWFETELAELRSSDLRLWEFVQDPGDLVYIPAFAIHAVVNLEDVMGFTLELTPERGM
jgi:hypothetical protein